MHIHHLAFLLLFQFPFACDKVLEFPQSSHLPDCLQQQKGDKSGAANIVFKSTNSGQTWQDISEGLPEPVQDNYGSYRDIFFADDNGLLLTAGDGIYYSKPNSTAPFWTKSILPDSLFRFIGEHNSITPGKTGIVAVNYDGQILQKINGTGVWLPMYTNLQEKKRLTVFETAGGAIFIGSENGLFKSTNSGNTWKQVHTGGWVMKLAALNGVLMATSQQGIIRSTDDGENWNLVISEGGVGIDVESIKGGFAAITYNTASETRRVRTSYDGGKTWQSIDAGLPASFSIASIIQVGEYFFCGHPAGIFRSSDKGKSWKLIFPSIKNKVFNLSVSGNVIYAVPKDGGC